MREKPLFTFPDTSRNLRERVAQAEHGLLGKTACTSSNADADAFIAVEHDTVVGLNEEVGNTARDVGEQTDGVSARSRVSRERSEIEGR